MEMVGRLATSTSNSGLLSSERLGLVTDSPFFSSSSEFSAASSYIICIPPTFLTAFELLIPLSERPWLIEETEIGKPP